MMDADVLAGLKAALRDHEISNGSPYSLYFAGKAKSGGSFGFMQGDLAARQEQAASAFKTCLERANFTQQEIGRYIGLLSVPCPDNPLTQAETSRVNRALTDAADVVDSMDQKIFEKVSSHVEKCIDAAAGAGRKINAEALIYMALWINMTGYPDRLIEWLKGGQPQMVKRPDVAPATVDGAAMKNYLGCTDYYTKNPRNFQRLQECVTRGLAKLT
jgi:hypothetical protein